MNENVPVWRKKNGAGSMKHWRCPQCPWGSVSFQAVEDHMEDHHGIPIPQGG